MTLSERPKAFFSDPATALARIEGRVLPDAPWIYTDDTVMAMSVVETLEHHGSIASTDWAAASQRGWVGERRATCQCAG